MVASTTTTTPATRATAVVTRRRLATDVARCPATTVAAMGPTTWPAPGAWVRRAVPTPAARDTARSHASGAIAGGCQARRAGPRTGTVPCLRCGAGGVGGGGP